MRHTTEGTLLRIFIGDSDRFAGKPLYEAIVRKAHELGVGGATVLHGPMGFGRHSRLHTSKLAELSSDLPIVIELVDSDEAIENFLPSLDQFVFEGLVTLEKVRVVRFSAGP